MARKGQQFRSFSPEFKLEAVKMYIEEFKGAKTIAKQLGLPDHSDVHRWVKAYKELGEAGLQDRRGTGGSGKGRPPKPKSLEEENLRLRAENGLTIYGT